MTESDIRHRLTRLLEDIDSQLSLQSHMALAHVGVAVTDRIWMDDVSSLVASVNARRSMTLALDREALQEVISRLESE